MFTQYQLSGSPNNSQVMADIIAILTGTTDVNALSASCDKATTIINSVNAPNWMVHDAAAGTNKICFKSLNTDGLTYKYMTVQYTTNNLFIDTFESWNAVTHIGTNGCCNNGNNLGFTLSASSILAIFASARYAAFTVRNAGTWSEMVGCYEFSRDDAWNTAAAGYPCFVQMMAGLAWAYNTTATQVGVSVPRMKMPSGDKTGVSAFMQLACPVMISGMAGSTGIMPGVSNVQTHSSPTRGANFEIEMPVWDLRVQRVSIQEAGGFFMRGGKLLGGIQGSTEYIGIKGDEMTYNGDPYFVWNPTSGGAGFLMPKF